MLVRAVPLKKLLTGYIGKHTCGMENTILHFLQIVYRIASKPTIISTAVIVLYYRLDIYQFADYKLYRCIMYRLQVFD